LLKPLFNLIALGDRHDDAEEAVHQNLWLPDERL